MFTTTEVFFYSFNEKLQSPRFGIINVTTSDSEHTFLLYLIAMYIYIAVFRPQRMIPLDEMTINVTTTHFIHHYKLCFNHII